MESISKQAHEAVIAKYLETISVPKEKGGKQFFLCPVGFVGAGKSTVLDLLCKHFQIVRISGDQIRKILREDGYAKEPGSGLPQRIFDEMVKKFAEEGYSIALDSNCGSPKAKGIIEQRAASLSAKVFWIHINPPEEYILNKLRNHPPSWLYRDGEHAVQRYQFHRDNNPRANIDFFYSFDPSKPDIQEQAGACVALMRQELEKHDEQREIKIR